ncbi:MAG: hypothetical protein HY287_16880 [Planctomycetes bacterium]|nr:hypothetical protein [Planctomycetota bacterium]MBI3836003.1 hypothetical protein [Planctomycetota bacterium]
MTKLLNKALDEVSKLAADEQDSVARWLLDELESERHWDEAFRNFSDKLGNLADEALREHRSGGTCPLDFDNS